MTRKFGGKVKRVLTVCELADEGYDKAYWHAKTPLERLAATELMRQINYGYNPLTDRIQRVFTIVEREKSI
jgi:hypothetical protein